MSIDEFLSKVIDFDLLSQKEKVKNIAYFYSSLNNAETFNSNQLKDFINENNLDHPANITRELISLMKSKPAILVKKENGYSFQRNSKKQLDAIFIASRHSKEISVTLRGLLLKITTNEQKSFLEEAISCFEIKAYRAAIIMTWLISMDVLLEFTLNNKIAEFNDELRKKNKKKFILSKSDFEEYKESEIIETMKAAGIVSKEQKKILDEKLNIRNSAAHPNTTQFKEPKVITYIEELVAEIINKY